MNDPEMLSEGRGEKGEPCAVNSETGIRCPLTVRQVGVEKLTGDFSEHLAEAGCPVAHAIQSLRIFGSKLAELSATFVNVPANQVDSQIESALVKVVEFLDLDRVGFGEVMADGKFVVTHSYQLPGTPPSAQVVLSSQFPTYARMLRQAKIVRIPDDLPDEATPELEYCRQTGLKSNLTIPLTVMGKVVGAVGFTSYRSQRVLPDEFIPPLRLVGDIFTNALARKRADEELQANEQSLRQTQQRLENLAVKLLDAQEEERRRIAREMHDDWTQRLAILGMETAKLNKHLDATDGSQALLTGIREQLVSLSEDVHDLSRQLHPSILSDLGLVEALRSECAAFSRRQNITIDYRSDNAPTNISADIALVIYRVAQESLRNIAKHAGVPKAWISLATVGPQLQLLVFDQGKGFETEKPSVQAGIGLSSIEERVRLIGGELSIESAPGKGTTIEVRVTLPESVV